jgi:membrane protease YdiL (CAAX protease family)
VQVWLDIIFEILNTICMDKTIRNICIFIFVALSCGWLGFIIDKVLVSQSNEETLGMGIWLVFPLITTIILRFFAKDGWKDFRIKPNFKGNIKWYFVSIIIFPSVTLIVLVIGKLLGWINFTNFRANIYFLGLSGALIIEFLKNFFEESVWRGYLTEKLLKTKIKDIWLYLVVGVVWGLWHLPYYLFFLPQSDMYIVLPVSRVIFALVGIIIMISWTIMYVELYRTTNSIWPVVLMHMMEDSSINHLIIDGHITILNGKEILISPIAGIITSLLYICVGLIIRKKRIKKESKISQTST